MQPVLARVEPAAIDVLVNKDTWRSPDTARTERWQLTHGTLGGADVFLSRGAAAALSFTVLDDFGVFQRDLGPCPVPMPISMQRRRMW